MVESPEFAVVGAGLAGPLMALYLARAGRAVTLYERRSDPRVAGHTEGKSINLALSLRGLHALGEVGLADAALAQAIAMRGRVMHAPDGRQTFQRYGRDDSECINSISRGGLNLLLIEAAAKHPNVRLAFDHRCTGIDLAGGRMQFATPGGAVEATARHVIAADGAFSAVRREMQRQERFNYSQDYLPYGYKELTLPAGAGGVHQIERHALHIWPRRSYMMIALPNLDGSFTVTLFAPYGGENGFDRLTTPAAIREYFETRFADAARLMPGLVEEFQANPTGALVTVRCGPWSFGDRATLMGDAAHAVVPFYGQGMNASFEDCSELANRLAAGGGVERAFRAYHERRKPNTDALSRLAIENFVEMRDKVGSRAFLWKKKLDAWLHKLLPGVYVPLYSLVTFSRVPYAEAERRGRRQDCGLLLIAAALCVLLAAAVARGAAGMSGAESVLAGLATTGAAAAGLWQWSRRRVRLREARIE